jgi:uncharacterized OB-fold protein
MNCSTGKGEVSMVDQPANETAAKKKQVPVQTGLFYQPQSAAEKPYLIGSKCKVCGYISFPKVLVCPRCLKKDTIEEAHFGAKGKIDTFSTCNAALPGFPAPTIQAYINLDEGGRIWSQITGTDMSGKDLKMGMEVELVIEKLREERDGTEIMSYKFRPIRK